MRTVRGLFLVIGLALSAIAQASEYAGVVETVTGESYIERSGARVSVAPGTLVFQADRVFTGRASFVGMTLRDDTLLTLGPLTALSLDSYAFDAKTHQGRFLAYLPRGVLSVVTGSIAKRSPRSFVVKTRISTIGVSGTEFIVEAHDL
ncbi:MAG: FecR family protein [Burkholderiales bacterium]